MLHLFKIHVQQVKSQRTDSHRCGIINSTTNEHNICTIWFGITRLTTSSKDQSQKTTTCICLRFLVFGLCYLSCVIVTGLLACKS